jgi:hypothetical protein
MVAIALCSDTLFGYRSRNGKVARKLALVLPFVVSISFVLIAHIVLPAWFDPQQSATTPTARGRSPSARRATCPPPPEISMTAKYLRKANILTKERMLIQQRVSHGARTRSSDFMSNQDFRYSAPGG